MHWYEDSKFWTLFRRHTGRLADWEAGRAEVAHIEQLAGLKPGMTLLDLCCGLGRHTCAFAERGYQATGVDATETLLDEARCHGQEAGFDIEFIHASMLDFRRDGAFDAVINLWTAFGYYEDDEDNRRVLHNIRASLRPGGTLVMEMMAKEQVCARFIARDWSEANDIVMLGERSFSDDCSHLKNRWIYLADGERHEFHVNIWLYSARELRLMLADAGFSDIQFFGALDSTPFSPTAPRLVALAC